MKIEIQVATAPDREFPVAELWFEGEMLAEVSQEKSNRLEVEFYATSTGSKFDYDSLLNGLMRAKEELNKESAFENPDSN